VSGLKWWMRVVGALYLFMFVTAALLRIPIDVEGPPGALARAAAGDPLARFVVDTWVTLGLEFGAVGVALLLASRQALRARALLAAPLCMEVAGIVADLYKILRGYTTPAPFVWMVIHAVVLVTGLHLLRRTREAQQPGTVPTLGALGQRS
jgi:BphX-like